jgi:hypothetical protein
MIRLSVLITISFMFALDVALAQTKPDLNVTWNSNYGHMNWGFWYGKPTNNFSGTLKQSGGKWVYDGRYTDLLNPASSRGTLYFEFSNDGSSFTGQWKNSVSGRSGAWSGQRYQGDAYPAATAYQARFGVPLCNGDLFARGSRDNETNSACSIPKEYDGIDIDGLIRDMNYDKFHEACRLHDICYSSPWRARNAEGDGKSACDDQFLTDLQQKCNDDHNDGSPRWIRCRAAARTMSVAVNNFSVAQNSYDRGQRWSSRHCE